MGCPCSKQLDNNKSLPNPLQQLKAAEASVDGHGQQRRRRRRQEEKRQRQLAKLQKRNARKRRHQQGSLRRSHSSAGNNATPLPQLRLRGGSNGSTATECISALYVRTLEQQRDEHQRNIELRTRHQLERQLHTFLLNQLLLGMQFFGHFEHELAAIDEQLLARQRACSQTLSEHSLLQASAIDAAVAKRLLFKPSDANQRGQGSNHNAIPAELLQKPLTYVVFENVDVARPNDANYDSIAALCKVLLETDYNMTTPCRLQYAQLLEQSRWMGYVRLKLREPATRHSPSSNATSEAGDGDADNEPIYTDASSSGYSTGGGTAASRASCDEGDYDHVYIARLNTQRSIAELQLDARVTLQRNVLPEECISRLGSCLPTWLDGDGDDDDDEEEEDEDDDELHSNASSDSEPELRSGYETVQVLRQCRTEQLRRRAQLQQCYLSSQRFMHYFGQLLRQQLAQQLHISVEQLATASYRGCSIYTVHEELVPAIHVPHGWPDCAFEFNLRQRPLDAWPTLQMRKRIQSFGYHVVPVGYAPKRARNPFRELEWRIIFPQAEQYLERQLSRLQLKLLLLLKILVRSLINDKCQAMGHIVEQLRTHLFWLCEGCVEQTEEHEEFLGEQLVRFVRSFADCLTKKQLRDYFIERRNLFEHVPEDALMELRAIMAAIGEQPLLHVLQALRQLQHADDFYPKFNYGQLLETLLASDYLQLRSQAKFTRQALPQTEQLVVEEQQQPQEETSSGAQGLLGMRQHQERTRGKLRRKTQLLRAQQLQQLQLAEQQRRNSLDLEMPSLLMQPPRNSQTSQVSNESCASTPQLNDGVEILRRTNLLEQLLDHQLAMLAKATEYRNAQHGQLYLEQAQRLSRLYQQLGCSQAAQQHYAQAICQAASQLERNLNSSPRVSCNSSSRGGGCQSLKFVEHVVQLHSGEVLPLQRSSPPPTPPATLTSASNPATVLAPSPTEDVAEHDALSAPVAAAVNKLDALLQRMQLEPPVPLQTIGSKTEQLVQNLELRNLLKRHTQTLKSVFN